MLFSQQYFITFETSSVVFGLIRHGDWPWYLFIQSLLKGARSSDEAEESIVDRSEVGEDRSERRDEIWLEVNEVYFVERGGRVEANRGRKDIIRREREEIDKRFMVAGRCWAVFLCIYVDSGNL